MTAPDHATKPFETILRERGIHTWYFLSSLPLGPSERGRCGGAVGRGGRPCPSKSTRKAILCVRRGTKAVSSDRSVPYGRKRSGPFASDFRSSTTNAHLAMFNLAIDSKLRGCDLVSLRVDDIAVGGHVRDRATIIQRKNRPSGPVRNHGATRASLQDWLTRDRQIGPLRLSEPIPGTTPRGHVCVRARLAQTKSEHHPPRSREHGPLS